MENLNKQIGEFYKSKDELEQRMHKLAKTFLYGGYINVRNEYHIYIRTVEFYYHEETGKVEKHKDPIMYHRNNNYVAGEIPYFKPLTFNSHDTGVDITFEDKSRKIRASVLIRAYEVFDVRSAQPIRLVWNTNKQQFQKYEDVKNDETQKNIKLYNTQSTYIKKFLNGFVSTGVPDIVWQSQPVSYFREINDTQDDKFITAIKRQGVYESSPETRYVRKQKQLDERKWGFRREKDMELK